MTPSPSRPPSRHASRLVLRAGQIGQLSLALFALAACGGATEQPAEALAAEAQAVVSAPIRLPYGSDPSQFGELRVPSGPGPHPVVVILHGGCWLDLFGLDLMDTMSEDLTNEGLATWNIEYRRISLGSTAPGYPDMFLDVGAAIDELRALAPVYDLDLDRVATVGHSAGGHLAAWAAARPNLPTTSVIRGSDPLPLYGAVSLAGVLDLAQSLELDICVDLAGQLLGGTPAEVPERYAETSPAQLTPIGVRQVLVHGTADTIVPLVVSENYRDGAQGTGDKISLKKIQNGDHFDVIYPSSTKWPQVRERILGLFEE